ncbi:hypothetical protein [Kamptonema sp. UHCC 0994]|uniref:hypothetical protein n=1 Tax=Kamptonema sp. UHCC 0994 TaxID=3031329 RepID=UPI0023B8AB9D|nr:hypothetical protein [Kamptonema sp. UHCC 0994]MDF0553884.1 hypothetical protein [Kamptonema sp. UHCC 0994]
MALFCPVDMGIGIDKNNVALAAFWGWDVWWERVFESGTQNVFWSDYSEWMLKPSVGIYNRPIVTLSRSGNTRIFTSFQIQLQRRIEGVGYVSVCRAVSDNDRNFFGGGSPPPPRRKKECDCMDCGCNCNDIATMIARQLAEESRLFEGLKDHIDRRVKEEITIHAKQLEAMTVDLQPIMDRVNEVENNLWNGIRK